MALEGCDRVTGTQIRASRNRSDCTPVGYRFQQYSLDDIRSFGENDLNDVFQPRR